MKKVFGITTLVLLSVLFIFGGIAFAQDSTPTPPPVPFDYGDMMGDSYDGMGNGSDMMDSYDSDMSDMMNSYGGDMSDMMDSYGGDMSAMSAMMGDNSSGMDDGYNGMGEYGR